MNSKNSKTFDHIGKMEKYKKSRIKTINLEHQL